MGGEVADDDGELGLEDDELSRGPDMSSQLQPVNLPPHDAEEEEEEEDAVHHKHGLDDPHGDSCDVLKSRGLGWVICWS